LDAIDPDVDDIDPPGRISPRSALPIKSNGFEIPRPSSRRFEAQVRVGSRSFFSSKPRLRRSTRWHLHGTLPGTSGERAARAFIAACAWRNMEIARAKPAPAPG